MTEVKKPKPLKPGESLDNAVYCANCEHYKEEIIGSKVGGCYGYSVSDSNMPMDCPYYKNEIRVISAMIFLKSGISIYHRTIVRNMTTQIDPQLLSSFLQAINMFGEELTKEPVSQIQFQKTNIIICKGDFAYGALLVKGDVKEDSKKIFSDFLFNVEKKFPDYFGNDFKGTCLPKEEVDSIALSSMKKYYSDKMYNIPLEIIENSCNLKCAKY
ncbi:MAG: hypothetical protein HWN67_12970 [Candidatus Helarchaeota archaeon]|nr:hypothetical protein [Candidatus Helarchaeota archaeon]